MEIFATIKPGSRKGPLAEQQDDGSYLIYVREHAVEGRATAAAIRVLAEKLRIAPSRITLARGGKSRKKMFRVE